jgi:hypothetical protein
MTQAGLTRAVGYLAEGHAGPLEERGVVAQVGERRESVRRGLVGLLQTHEKGAVKADDEAVRDLLSGEWMGHER